MPGMRLVNIVNSQVGNRMNISMRRWEWTILAWGFVIGGCDHVAETPSRSPRPVQEALPPVSEPFTPEPTSAVEPPTSLGIPESTGEEPLEVETEPFWSVRDNVTSQRLVAQARSRLSESETFLRQAEIAQSKGQLAQLSPRSIGENYVAVLQLERFARRLVYHAEPAGFDFKRRAASLHQRTEALVEAYRRLPGVKQQLKRSYPALKLQSHELAKKLPAIEAMMAKTHWQRAERELDEIFDRLAASAVWYSGSMKRAIIEPFDAVRATVEAEMINRRGQKARSGLAVLRHEATPNFATPLQTFRQATAKLESGENVGPRVVQDLARQWRALQRQVIRCEGIDHARGIQSSESTPSELDKLLAAYDAFCGQAVDAIVQRVQQDADELPEERLRQAYIEYLTAIAGLQRMLADDALREAIARPLERFLQRSPELAAEVRAYQRTTHELLAKRRQAAERQAHAYAGKGRSVAVRLLEASRSGLHTTGLVSRVAPSMAQAALVSTLPQAVRQLRQGMVGKNVTVTNLRGGALDTGAKVASLYQERIYVRLTLPPEWEQETARLKQELLSRVPLTLEAAQALETARQGDLVAASGSVRSVEVQPVVQFLARFDFVQSMAVPLGPLQPDPRMVRPLNQVMIHLEIDPAWVHHKYFYLEIARVSDE